MPDIHADILANLAGDTIRPFYFIHMYIDGVNYCYTDCDITLKDPGDSNRLYYARRMKRSNLNYSKHKVVDSWRFKLDNRDSILTAAFQGGTPEGSTVTYKLALLDEDHEHIQNPITLFQGQLDKWDLDEEWVDVVCTNERSKWNQTTTCKYSPSCSHKVFGGPYCAYGGDSELNPKYRLEGDSGSQSGTGTVSGDSADGSSTYVHSGETVVCSKCPHTDAQIFEANGGAGFVFNVPSSLFSITSGNVYILIVDILGMPLTHINNTSQLSVSLRRSDYTNPTSDAFGLVPGINKIELTATASDSQQRIYFAFNSFTSAYKIAIGSASIKQKLSSPVTECDRSYNRCSQLGNTDMFRGHRFLPTIIDKVIWWGREFGKEPPR